VTPAGVSDDLDGDAVGVGSERLDVTTITREDGAARFGEGHDEGIDRGTRAGASPEFGGAACEVSADRRLDDARLEEPVGVRVTACVTVE
jgi:hypothetical protein